MKKLGQLFIPFSGGLIFIAPNRPLGWLDPFSQNMIFSSRSADSANNFFNDGFRGSAEVTSGRDVSVRRQAARKIQRVGS